MTFRRGLEQYLEILNVYPRMIRASAWQGPGSTLRVRKNRTVLNEWEREGGTPLSKTDPALFSCSKRRPLIFGASFVILNPELTYLSEMQHIPPS